jgi:hypothetical protein
MAMVKVFNGSVHIDVPVKLVTLTLTEADCLNMRMALNATAIHWGEVATAARNDGRQIDADTCERIRSDYHRLWELVNVAQEAAPDGPRANAHEIAWHLARADAAQAKGEPYYAAF